MSAAEAGSNRPRPLLLILLGLVLLIAGWRFLPSFGGGADIAGAASADLNSRTIEVVELAPHILEQPSPKSAPTRDPWSFGSRPAPRDEAPPPPPEPPPEPKPLPVQPVVPDRLKPKPPPPKPVGPSPPAVKIAYLGTLGPDDNPVAVFTDCEEIHNAFVGDLVQDQFKVQRIGYESVDLLFEDFPDEPPVRLAIGGKPNCG